MYNSCPDWGEEEGRGGTLNYGIDKQWRNRQGGGGRVFQCLPPRLLTRKFLLTYWEKGKRGEN